MTTTDKAIASGSFEWGRYAAAIAVLAGAYAIAARYGIEQPVAHGVVTPVWAPSGIAIGALLLFGFRYWPAVTIGAFIANAGSDVSVPVAAAIAIGNTLEAVTAHSLLKRVRFDIAFRRVRDVLYFIGLAALVATAVSATIGVSTLVVANAIEFGSFGGEWLLWWFGDLIGALLVAPLILVWGAQLRARRIPGRLPELVVMLVLLCVTASAIFIGGNWQYPYVIFPLLVWAALRFGPLGATAAIFIVGSIATWGTVHGAVPIGGATATQSVQILQGLIAVVGLGTFVIAATIAERDAAESQRADALDELHDRNVMYETVLQAVSDLGEGFVVTDAGRLVFANPAYCEMTGYTLEELRALPSLLELTAPEDREEVVNRLRERLSGSEVQDHYEASLIRKDGQRVACEVAVKLVRTDEGAQIISIVRDVTDRKQMENFRENFVSYVAHEMRTPITIILGFSDLLKRARTLDDDQLEDVVERLGTNSATMKERLDTILRLAGVEQGSTEVFTEKIDLEHFLTDVTAEIPRPEGKTLVIDADGAVARLDTRGLQQIVANLVTNAYRYGGDNVLVEARRRDDTVTIEVSDDGPGVPPALVDRVFEPFVRAGETSEGAGLGLSVVKALARAGGGDVVYEARPQRAVFRVTLRTE